MGYLKRLEEERRLRRMDPVAMEEARQKTVKAGKLIWFGAGASLLSTIATAVDGASLLRIGSSLAVVTAMAMSALTITDHSSDRETPRLLRWTVYALILASSIMIAVGLFQRWHH